MSKLLAIDIGHGKNTYPPNKGVPQMPEFEFNNAVGKYANELAKLNGFNVLLTQPFDANEVTLTNRTNLAIQKKVDLMISIHADASGDPSANGHWVFHWTDKGTTDQSVIRIARESKKVAQIWDKYANQIMGNTCRGIRESVPGTWTNLHITREPVTNRRYKFPSILCEHDFMTSPVGLKNLLSDNFRKKCAEVLVRTACEYFGMQFKLPQNFYNDKNSGIVGGESLPTLLKTANVRYNGKTLNSWLSSEGRTVAEVRQLAEMLGLGVKWDSSTKTVELANKSQGSGVSNTEAPAKTSIPKLTQVAKTRYNDKTLNSWLTSEGRTVAEVRQLAEMVGLGLKWDGKTSTVDLFDK